MKNSELLTAAWGIVSLNPTTGAMARTNTGSLVGVESPAACSFCSAGAVHRVTSLMNEGVIGSVFEPLTWAAKQILLRENLRTSAHPVVTINDDFPQHREEMFRRAIAIAKEEEDGPSCAVIT